MKFVKQELYLDNLIIDLRCERMQVRQCTPSRNVEAGIS